MCNVVVPQPDCVMDQLRPGGGNPRVGTRLRGPEVLGPLRGLGIRPLVLAIRGLRHPLPGRLFRGLGEVYSLSTEWENKVGHSEAPKRSHFPGWPLRGFQPSAPTLRPQMNGFWCRSWCVCVGV